MSSVCDLFTVEDLFVVGLALDVTGAYLLARGLLVSPSMIGKLARSYYDWNAIDAVDRVRSRVDAEFGIAMLIGGFVLQAIGYLLVLLEVPTRVGAGRLGIACLLALVAVGFAWLIYRRFGEARVKRWLSQVALTYERDDDEPPGWTDFKATVLTSYGVAAGYSRLPDEDRAAYLERVFGVTLPAQDD